MYAAVMKLRSVYTPFGQSDQQISNIQNDEIVAVSMKNIRKYRTLNNDAIVKNTFQIYHFYVNISFVCHVRA